MFGQHLSVPSLRLLLGQRWNMRACTCVPTRSNHACLCSYLCPEDRGWHTDTSDPAAAPAPGHRSLVPLHVCTFVPLTGRSRCLLFLFTQLFCRPHLADPGPAGLHPSHRPTALSLMRGSALPCSPPMPGHLAAFPPGRKTPDRSISPPLALPVL